MKKIKENKNKKLSIKFPNTTFTAVIDGDVNLKKGEFIKLKITSKLGMVAKVTVSQYEYEKNIDRIEAESVDSVDESKIKEVFIV